MLTKAKIPRQTDDSLVLPVMIPDLRKVKAFAAHLHRVGRRWKGDLFGWPAEYTPEKRKKPVGSKMQFTPADLGLAKAASGSIHSCGSMEKTENPTNFWMTVEPSNKPVLAIGRVI